MQKVNESLFIPGWRGFFIHCRNWILVTCSLLFLSGCSPTTADRGSAFENWEPIANEYARSFQLLAKEDQRILIVFGAGGRTDTAGIYLIGTDPWKDLQPLPVLTDVIVASTTQLPFFNALGKGDLIRGVVHSEDLFDRGIAERVANGSIKDVGTAEGLDQEMVHALRPQVIFDHPFGRNMRNAGSNVPVIHVTEYLEEHPLGRAEWLKFFGVLFGEEDRAARSFNDIEERYLSVRTMASAYADRPVVFFASSWQGQWFAPPTNSYMARLIADAGAKYALADRKAEGNITMDLETVLHKVRRSDHFGMILSTTDSITAGILAAGEPRLAKIEAVHSGGFFGNSAVSDLFGKAILEPDVVLADLVNIFHRSDTGEIRFTYFKPLAGPISGATDPRHAPGNVDRSPVDDEARGPRSPSRSHAH